MESGPSTHSELTTSLALTLTLGQKISKINGCTRNSNSHTTSNEVYRAAAVKQSRHEPCKRQAPAAAGRNTSSSHYSVSRRIRLHIITCMPKCPVEINIAYLWVQIKCVPKPYAYSHNFLEAVRDPLATQLPTAYK